MVACSRLTFYPTHCIHLHPVAASKLEGTPSAARSLEALFYTAALAPCAAPLQLPCKTDFGRPCHYLYILGVEKGGPSIALLGAMTTFERHTDSAMYPDAS